MAAYGDWIVLSEFPPPSDSISAVSYELWNTSTGERRPVWQSDPGTGDMTFGVSGDWIATVRVGQGLPFAEWQLILRNLATGEARTIAKSDPRVAAIPGLPVGLPTGFAPSPSLSGSRLVWAEFALDAQGRAQKRIELYDLADGTTSVLTAVDPFVEDVWQPSVGGNVVAWAQRPQQGPQEVVTMELSSGRRRAFSVGGEIFSCALSGDGRYLAWDDAYIAKYAMTLASGDVVKYAADEGWGTNRSGDLVSWQPSAGGSLVSGQASNGDGGYYSFAAHQVRFISTAENASIIMATVMGNWFVWQERPAGSVSLPATTERGSRGTSPPDYFYFIRRAN